MIYTTPDGKQWEVVDVRVPKEDEFYVAPSGRVGRCQKLINTYPIVRPVVPEWVVPTDEDVKQRPMVEVRNHELEEWDKRKLVYVGKRTFAFITVDEQDLRGNWKFCRMRNPEYGANP